MGQVLNFTFPQDKRAPAGRSQELLVTPVTRRVLRDLLGPIFGIVLWPSSATVAIMPVPKTPMHENDRSAWPKYYVWLPGKVVRIKSIAISHRMKETTDAHLGAGIMRSHSPHDAAACFIRLRFFRRHV